MRLTDLILFLFIPLLSPDISLKQPLQEEVWTKEELTAANTAGDAKYLTGEEKDMVIYMNLARMDGEKFFNTYFQDYMEQHNRQMIKYSNYNELKISKLISTTKAWKAI